MVLTPPVDQNHMSVFIIDYDLRTPLHTLHTDYIETMSFKWWETRYAAVPIEVHRKIQAFFSHGRSSFENFPKLVSFSILSLRLQEGGRGSSGLIFQNIFKLRAHSSL